MKRPTPDGPKPQPGDVVILDHDYDPLVELGARGVIDGSFFGEDGEALVCFNLYGGAAFREQHDDRDDVVSCSGGPVPFVKLAALSFDGITDQTFWRFKNGHRRAHNGEQYSLQVNAWRWCWS